MRRVTKKRPKNNINMKPSTAERRKDNNRRSGDKGRRALESPVTERTRERLTKKENWHLRPLFKGPIHISPDFYKEKETPLL